MARRQQPVGRYTVYSIDAELYRIGRSMAALGVYIDPAKRFSFAQEYQPKSDKLKAEFVVKLKL